MHAIAHCHTDGHGKDADDGASGMGGQFAQK
jgi:hypothetical protein